MNRDYRKISFTLLGYKRYKDTVVLGDVMVSVLDTGLKVPGFSPSRDDGFLRAMKVRSTPSLGGEEMLSAPCRLSF
jgi:hypothetical protein